MKTGKLIQMACVVIALGGAWAREPLLNVQDRAEGQGALQPRSARDTVRTFLRCVKSGKSRDAFALTTGRGNGWSQNFPRLAQFDQIRPLHQVGTDHYAVILSNPFQSRGRTEVFYAFLVKHNGQWLIRRNARITPREGLWMMRGCMANPALKVDVLPDVLVGTWWAVCDSTIIMAADGTGTELSVGPGGPVPGETPEPFTWEVSGSTLRRQFADRKETLDITWLHDNSVSFRFPNDSPWSSWNRRKHKTAETDPWD